MSEVPQNLAKSADDQASERVFKALQAARSQLEAIQQAQNEQVAVIGMAGRFPGADNLDEFWNLLDQGKSGICTLSDEALRAAGVPESTFSQPNYVRAYASFSNPSGFDAQFFGYAPSEAELMDPQHRVFLECAWSALEDAGYDSQQYDGTIGVYGGAALNSYLVNLHTNPAIRASISPVQAVVSNVMGLMPTRVSYQLDLKGPSCGIQTGCSTSLVAIHSACQSLLNHDCDIALAGGVTVSSATPQGYLYQAESIASPDGSCRAFDEKGQGTVFGNGVGIVVLKRLRAAQLEGDHIYAIVKGSAINNDGADKVGLIAPSVSGQAAVIQAAIEKAGVDPCTISYVEAHGTGTPLGDPIEVAALNRAFEKARSKPDKSKIEQSKTEQLTAERQSCAIGSVKTNLGHLDAAAGAAGFIKTVLALQHKILPASLNYTRPNTQIDFQNGPFVVNHQRQPWSHNSAEDNLPRRAGVSSFGMGGTNAHAILEEAPATVPSGNARPWQLITLSAKTPTALDTAAHNLATHLQRHPEQPLADVAYTLQTGRRAWPYRRFHLCQTTAEAITQLSHPDKDQGTSATPQKSVVFMFSGQGSQHINMARDLYESEPTFQKTIDKCADILADQLPLLDLLYPSLPLSSPPLPLNQTANAQPTLFALEYALAKLWISWGVQPTALIGHSIGEYVAACIAGIFSLEDALFLTVQRGQLMQRCQPGSMLSVLAAAETLETSLSAEAEIAAINSPQNCVVSGPTTVIQTLQQQLQQQNIPCRLLATSHAFHSAMMEPALEEFSKALQKVTFSPPQIDLISNVTGTWLAESDATNPDYWVRHLRSTVRFSRGIKEVLNLPNPVLLEIGPGHTLTRLAKQHLSTDSTINHNSLILQSLPHPQERKSEGKTDSATLMKALGELWLAGLPITWTQLYQGGNRHRLSLPTYPFERTPYWVPLRSEEGSPSTAKTAPKTKAADRADWFYVPTWQRLPLTTRATSTSDDCWLIFADKPFQSQLQQYFSTTNTHPNIIWVTPGSEFSHTVNSDRSPAENHYTIAPHKITDYQQFIQSLTDHQPFPTQVVQGWGVTHTADDTLSNPDSFRALLFLAQALAQANLSLTLSIVTTDVQDITGNDSLNPDKARTLGLCQVISQEYPGLPCRLIDIGSAAGAIDASAIQGLCRELVTPYNPSQRLTAHRQSQRWVQSYEPLPLPEQSPSMLKRNATYLIAGDLIEGLGMVYAQALVKEFDARLILLGRPGLPAAEAWDKWLITHSPQHEVSQLIRKLQALGQSGQQFLLFSGSLADAAWVSASVQQGVAHFGHVSGVFHAGVMGDHASCPIEQLNEEECDRICRSKIKGIQALQQALAQQPVDFYLLQSSLAAIVGGIGFGAYAAANSYLDTLANQQNNVTTRWLSLNWDACQLEETPTQGDSELMALAISAREVWQTTQTALAQPGCSQLIISPRSLKTRLEEAFTPSEPIPDPTSGQPPAAHARPTLATDYVAPRNAIEQTVAREMGDLLGIELVGIHDNFFELGGHSLLAIQAVTRLRKEFEVALPMRAFLFEAPTVAGIAQVIEENIFEATNTMSAETQSTLENLLGQIENMTPEEVENSS